jgi:sec-independent protein translocase protein TatC
MGRVGLISSQALADKRRYAIVGMFVFAAVVTPPDIISQIGLAIPLLLLYEISIWSVRLVEKQRAAREAAEEAELTGKTTT